MATSEDILNTLAEEIGFIVKGRQVAGHPELSIEAMAPDYNVIVCPERIFVDDYLEQKAKHINTNYDDLPYLGDDVPNDTLYSKTIFVVVKITGGQRNMAISNAEVSIQVLSEENAFDAARDILDAFVDRYNFSYEKSETFGTEIMQAYFPPTVSSSQDQVYAGFRALLSCSGVVRVPVKGVVFVRDICISLGEEGDWVRIPYITESYNYSAQPDPQAFAGQNGRTAALNRQSTTMVSFETYLTQDSGDGLLDAFSKAVIKAEKLNKKFHIVVRTMLEDEDEAEIFGERLFSIVDDWFVLVGASHNQQRAELSTWSLSFARAVRYEN